MSLPVGPAGLRQGDALMTVSKPQPELTAAEQARQSYRKKRSEGSQKKVDLDQPDVDGVLGFIDGDERYL